MVIYTYMYISVYEHFEKCRYKHVHLRKQIGTVKQRQEYQIDSKIYNIALLIDFLI